MTSRKAKLMIPYFQEKLRREMYINPYRKPTQVDWDENSKAIERTLVEGTLQNGAVTSGEGTPLLV
jgi:hypothetical protein